MTTTLDLNTVAIYILYVVLLAGTILAAYLRVIDLTVATATFTLIVGHFLGLQTPTPPLKTLVPIEGGPHA